MAAMVECADSKNAPETAVIYARGHDTSLEEFQLELVQTEPDRNHILVDYEDNITNEIVVSTREVAPPNEANHS